MILVDSHVVVWLAMDSDRISSQAREFIQDERAAGQGLAISCITLFELARLVSKRRVDVGVALTECLAQVEERFVVLPITARISALSQELPPEFPNDPGDRLIGATAWAEDLVLVTADRAIRRCAALRTVW